MRVRKYEINGAVVAWNGCGIVPKPIREYLEAHGCNWQTNDNNGSYWRMREALLAKVELPESKNHLQNQLIEKLRAWDITTLVDFHYALVGLMAEKGHGRKTIVKYLTFADQDPNGDGSMRDFREPYSLEVDDDEIVFAFFNEYIVSSGNVEIEWNKRTHSYRATIWDTENAQPIHRVENIMIVEAPLMDSPPEKKYTLSAITENQWVLSKLPSS